MPCSCHKFRREAGVQVLLVTCGAVARLEGRGAELPLPPHPPPPLVPPPLLPTLPCLPTPHLGTPGPACPAGSAATHTEQCSREQGSWVRARTMQDLGGPSRAGGSQPHLEGGNDPLASVLEEILIGPGWVLLGQGCGHVVVVAEPGDALSLQEGVLIPPGTPQVCKSHHDHQWGMSPLGLALPVAGGAHPAPWIQPSVPLSPRPSFSPGR